MRRLLVGLTVSGIVAILFFVGLPNGAGSPVAGTTSVVFASHSVGYSIPECTGFLHEGPYVNIVATGACELEAGSTVSGFVKVKPGASFTASGSEINGQFTGKEADFVTLTNMDMQRSISVDGTSNQVFIARSSVGQDLKVRDSGDVIIFRNTVGKDLWGNQNDDLKIGGNTVGKNLVAARNDDVIISNNSVGKDLKVGQNEDVVITDNIVVKTLDCRQNDEISGSGNTAAELKGQCEFFF